MPSLQQSKPNPYATLPIVLAFICHPGSQNPFRESRGRGYYI